MLHRYIYIDVASVKISAIRSIDQIIKILLFFYCQFFFGHNKTADAEYVVEASLTTFNYGNAVQYQYTLYIDN